VEKADAILARFEALKPSLDERSRRLFAAAEAQTAGPGGVSLRIACDRDRAKHD
jgi:hypothetical protein